jgi:hypothetical protein
MDPVSVLTAADFESARTGERPRHSPALNRSATIKYNSHPRRIAARDLARRAKEAARGVRNRTRGPSI